MEGRCEDVVNCVAINGDCMRGGRSFIARNGGFGALPFIEAIRIWT